MTDKKIVLAFSGGLDTSYCLFKLKNEGFIVHTVYVHTGSINENAEKSIKETALKLGSDHHKTIDASQLLWDEFVVPLIWTRGKMRGEYPLLCSDRYLIVKLCLDHCNEIGTTHIAHGCTAMGNDQFRFDQTINSLGDYEIHAPVRDLQKHIDGNIREHEIGVLNQHGFETPDLHQNYSVNENLLGVTISGSEIDTFDEPSADSNHWVQSQNQWPKEELLIDLEFQQGQAVSINGEPMNGPELLSQLNTKLGSYGVGRHIYTGDVSIGLKGRIVFECPGIDALMMAHKALEDAVNSKLQNQMRQTLSDRWSELIYQGFYYDPHKDDLEAYFQSSQSFVSGVVRLKTNGGALLAVSVQSPWIVQDSESTYAQSCSWSPDQAIGFIQLSGQSTTVLNKIRRETL
jgi:argininosuccinate synthase